MAMPSQIQGCTKQDMRSKTKESEIRWCIQILEDTNRKAENRRESTREDCGKTEEIADFSYTVQYKIEIKKKRSKKIRISIAVPNCTAHMKQEYHTLDGNPT